MLSKKPFPRGKKQSASDNEEYSPITGSPFETGNTFSFSPEKSNDSKGLAQALTSRPKQSITKATKRTITNLYDRAIENAIKKEKKTKAIFDAFHPFKPKLNPQSLKMIKIAKKEGKDLHHKKKIDLKNLQPDPIEKNHVKTVSIEGFIDRNYTNELIKSQERKIPQFVPLLDRLDKSCTFRPSIDEKSRLIVKTHKTDLYNKGMEKYREKKILIEKLKKNKEIEDLKKCTFSPNLRKENILSDKDYYRSKSEIKKYSTRTRSNENSPYRLSIQNSAKD